MKIIIEYESSWRNSFLDGNNNEPLPKSGRKFIGSMRSLKNTDNFIKRDITIDTVMGVLNRLIGDQRKLYQSRVEDGYFFKDIESLITFNDKPEFINNEMTYIRNITGSTDQNSYTGMIKVNDPMFLSDYSAEFWGVLALNLEELCKFITRPNIVNEKIQVDPLTIMTRLEELDKEKPVENTGVMNETFQVLTNKFCKFKGINNKGLITPIALYCSALYLQLELLSKKYDMSTAKTKAGGISGISNNGFTKKDFMSRFTTGEKKKVWGNPYIHEEFVKGEGKTKHLLTKVSGTLDIIIKIPRAQAKDINEMIENAGVSSFYLGKKGLAYVSKISTREEL
ncbi:type I-Fv CRISPR-associated protein Cas5fv [Moritella sp.]|uniref:type I-Fv CRISPR-associated protein Cas5fv n=1 Tax=Moritella sp. TaxID=78556 RepID=UPI0025F205CE|nr:type I-Fv CRISPR-associated protein Cas5fv [Moritella sp.]MCJ8348990.1 type I-Fv CRISPR-associated protein Cas5fv [Moritella sp.]